MSDPLKPRVPSRAPFDSQFPKEESHVRQRRTDGDPTDPGAEVSPRSVPRTDETVGERTARLERKMALAMAALKDLPPTAARARLLASALLRRDEVLLDAVLAEHAQAAMTAPPRVKR